jgi:NDP-sugar pyrophosphorylase family protein
MPPVQAKRAVILAGGEGSRLRPYTTVLPKPLMPVGDRPILDIIMRQLVAYGFERVTIATGYLAELIEVFFGDGAAYGLQIDYHREHEPLGTVGALATIEGLRDDHFLVMNGDVLTDIDYAELMRWHAESGADATIATHRKKVEISLGVLHFQDAADETRLTDYSEKPTYDYEVSMGVYCFAPTVLDHIEPNVRLDFPDLMLQLVERGHTVRGYRSDDYWLDLGRMEDYQQALDDFTDIQGRLLPNA